MGNVCVAFIHGERKNLFVRWWTMYVLKIRGGGHPNCTKRGPGVTARARYVTTFVQRSFRMHLERHPPLSFNGISQQCPNKRKTEFCPRFLSRYAKHELRLLVNCSGNLPFASTGLDRLMDLPKSKEKGASSLFSISVLPLPLPILSKAAWTLDSLQTRYQPSILSLET